MRWKTVFVGLAATLAATAGCKQQCFMTESDFNTPVTAGIKNLERDPSFGAQPIIAPAGRPANVLDPDRPVRYLSLAEAVSIALEQGSIGTGQPIPSGNPFQDQDLSFSGRTSTPNSIRVLALDPATVGTNIELALSKFDAVFNTSLSWSKTDRPVASSADTIQAGGATAITADGAEAKFSLFKPLPAGGVAGITFDVPYQLTSLPAQVNPSYTPSVQFQFEQPLLQGFGTEINQLRQSHPGSLILPNGGVLSGLPQPGVEGILITRIRFDQQRAEFQRNVNTMLSNVEVAYWNLYYSYWNLYSQEAALRQSYEAWKIAEVKLQAGKIAIADLAQTRAQYELFRSQRIAALDQVLESERQMRGMLGLPTDDGTRLTPSDSPTLAAYQPDWNAAMAEVLNNAPSLILLREEVKSDQMNVRLAENSLLPDLRFGATYDVNSLGSTLDGAGTDNALRNLSADHFNNWSLALRLNVPIGYRNAYANVRLAKLTMARNAESLKEQERRVTLAWTPPIVGFSPTMSRSRPSGRNERPWAKKSRRDSRSSRPARSLPICCWKLSDSGPRPCLRNTPRFATTITPWPTLRLSRARSPNTTTSSSPRERCRPSRPSGQSNTNGNAARPWRCESGRIRCRWLKHMWINRSRIFPSAPRATPPRCRNCGSPCLP